MVVKKKAKSDKKLNKEVEKVDEKEGGMDLDDAFGDDDGVEYAESKPKKKLNSKQMEKMVDDAVDVINGMQEPENRGSISINASKPISKVKKGDTMKIDGVEVKVDAHYVLMDHGSTKEMAVEVFDPKKDKDYQIRYFDDQVESTLDVYELQEIMYLKKICKSVSW